MDYPLRNHLLRSPSRRSSPSRLREYLGEADTMTQGYTNNGWKPPSSGRSTPSAAVRRALQVLDESYRQQEENRRWGNGCRQPSYRRGRSSSPSKSRTPSPVRKFLRDARSPVAREAVTPPLVLEIERDNLQDALGDSESRRNLLLRKLAETQRTMEIQNDAVKKGEMELRGSKAASKLLQQVQEELETKVQFLEKERNTHINRQLRDAEEKEALRRDADNFHHEAKRLQCQLDLMEVDKEERIKEINRAGEDIRNVEENNRKLLEKKSVLNDEVAALKESLSVAKQRVELLEKEKTRVAEDLRSLQDSQQAIIGRNTELSSRLNTAEGNNMQLRNSLDETQVAYQSSKHDIETYKEKNSKQGYKLAELQTTCKEVRGDLDRSNRYIAELERTLQSVKEINQRLKENKVILEDNLTNLHADLAKSRLECSKESDERVRLSEEFQAVTKSQKDLAAQLFEMRHQISSKEEELTQVQAARKIDTQKLGLLQTQKNQGETEMDELVTRMVKLQEAHEALNIRAKEDDQKNSQLIRELKAEKDRLHAKCKELDSRAERLSLELVATAEHDQSQLGHWRDTCSKLTSLMEERDREQRESASRLRSAEDTAERAESQAKALEKELSAMQNLQHELSELRNENNRLVREIKENQQLISVLETERDVLSQSPTKSSDDNQLSAEVKKLQSDLKMVLDQFSSSDSKKSQGAPQSGSQPDLKSLEVDLKRADEDNKLLNDEVAQVKKEADTLQSLMEARTNTHEREVRKMERERERLESRIRSLEDEARVLRSSLTNSARSPNPYVDGELRNLKVEGARLKLELEEKEQAFLVIKGQLVIAQSAKKSAEDRLAALECRARSTEVEKSPRSPNYHDTSWDTSSLQSELDANRARLEATEAECAALRSRAAELSGVRTKLENAIKALRKQNKELKSARKSDPDSFKSEDTERSATIELATIRRELQRAFEDVASKDRQLSELKRSLAKAQKQEQLARQERDELKGKTIVMESITDSSGHLRKELEKVRKQKREMEKQLKAYIKNNPDQTPHSDLAPSSDNDKELERQYKTVCERNKWLEGRISSLSREIELLRDQNALLTEEKIAAERRSEAMEGELKSAAISSKSRRNQSEIEQIHLQNSNDGQLQQILELQRVLQEKNVLVQNLSKQLEASRKNSDKKKISSFMKKLRKSSESTGVTCSPERGPLQPSAEPLVDKWGSAAGMTPFPTAFSNQATADQGYATMPSSNKSPKEKQNGNRNRSRSSPGFVSRVLHASQSDWATDLEDMQPLSRSYQQLNQDVPEFPTTMKGLSPSPTHPSSARHTDRMGSLRDSFPDYISDTGEPIGSPMRRSPVTVQTLPDPPRKKKDHGSKHDTASDYSCSDDSRSDEGQHARRSLADASGQFGRAASEPDRKRTHSSNRLTESVKCRNRPEPPSENESEDDRHDSDKDAPFASPTKQSRRSTDPMPEGLPPNPIPAPVLPTPASSPSVLSPTSARVRSVHIHVTGPEESNDDLPLVSSPQTEIA